MVHKVEEVWASSDGKLHRSKKAAEDHEAIEVVELALHFGTTYSFGIFGPAGRRITDDTMRSAKEIIASLRRMGYRVTLDAD